MRSVYAVHIVAGALGLISGFVALYAGKGKPLHRKAGMVFVHVMLTMSAAGLAIAIIRNVVPSMNVTAALLTAYLIVTSLTSVKPFARGARAVHFVGIAVASGIVLTNSAFAADVFAGRAPGGMPSFPFIMFGTVALLAVVGDVRITVSGPLRGVSRLARHLWRMCFALFIAALSFFIGQTKVIPEPIRIRPLLALPVLAVIVTMFYWLWRVRLRRSLRGLIIKSSSSNATVPTFASGD